MGEVAKANLAVGERREGRDLSRVLGRLKDIKSVEGEGVRLRFGQPTRDACRRSRAKRVTYASRSF